jgi:hypothetical protein
MRHGRDGGDRISNRRAGRCARAGVSERKNLFYSLPGCSGPVHGNSGRACKTLPFETVEETIAPTICRNSATLLYKSISAGEGHAPLGTRSSGAARLRTIR